MSVHQQKQHTFDDLRPVDPGDKQTADPQKRNNPKSKDTAHTGKV